jgi:hypothetical protein
MTKRYCARRKAEPKKVGKFPGTPEPMFCVDERKGSEDEGEKMYNKFHWKT